ncbi:type VI secretion system-associated FHA domain protein TagH [Roseomonas sp. AR75]|uniref:type VI secretion system-associated FHA domain protein TagH n=1 Tax=Roseomonas sp. AR75 TaxID=2562311 RepID=UPI0010BFB28F|nr:type VI secretion system-associated FHA domain protein TagH [Roseomonas sp. AR75]
MRLTLSTLRCPDSVAPETRSTGGGEFTLGRAPDNSWVLADPDRHLSKRHCVLAFRNGGWQIADTSTNGTYLNREGDPIGQGQVRDLRDGDRIRLGAYEIELRIEEDAIGTTPSAPASAFGAGNPFDDDPFAAAPQAAQPTTPPPPSWRDEDPMLPPDFDPLAPQEADPFAGPSLADHSPAVSDAFRPPAATPGAPLLPDDWDLDEPLLPPAAPAAPPPPPAPAPTPPGAFAPPEPPPPQPPPFVESAPPAFAPPPAAAATPTAPIAPPVSAAGDGALLAAFLRGAGVPGARIEDPAATMEALGGAFRALVSGLRAVLIARAAIKGEFRIEQTMIRARGNNPLKFSADDEDALAALLGTGRRAGMAPAESVAEALRDVKLHELASMAAMQKAVREMLAQLSPEAAQHAAGSGGLLPVQRKARAFEAFEAQHAALVAALADDFDSAFGKAFARAYEEALREAAARPEES